MNILTTFELTLAITGASEDSGYFRFLGCSSEWSRPHQRRAEHAYG